MHNDIATTAQINVCTRRVALVGVQCVLFVYTLYGSAACFARPFASVTALCPDAHVQGCADAPDIIHLGTPRFTVGENALRDDAGYRAAIQKTSYATGCVWLGVCAAAASLIAQTRVPQYWSHIGTLSLVVTPVWMRTLVVVLHNAAPRDNDYYVTTTTPTVWHVAVLALLSACIVALVCTVPTAARSANDVHSLRVRQYTSAWLVAMVLALWWAMDAFALVSAPYDWSARSRVLGVQRFTNTQLRPTLAYFVLGVSLGIVSFLSASCKWLPPSPMIARSVGVPTLVIFVSYLVVMQNDWTAQTESFRITRTMSHVTLVGSVIGIACALGTCLMVNNNGDTNADTANDEDGSFVVPEATRHNDPVQTKRISVPVTVAYDL